MHTFFRCTVGEIDPEKDETIDFASIKVDPLSEAIL